MLIVVLFGSSSLSIAEQQEPGSHVLMDYVIALLFLSWVHHLKSLGMQT